MRRAIMFVNANSGYCGRCGNWAASASCSGNLAKLSKASVNQGQSFRLTEKPAHSHGFPRNVREDIQHKVSQSLLHRDGEFELLAGTNGQNIVVFLPVF